MLTTPVWKHFAAFVYDLFPLVGIFIVTSLLVMVFRGGEIVEPGNRWFGLLLSIEILFYFIYSWKKGGQTLGMRAWRMKIIPIDNQTNTLSWQLASMRFAIGLISTMCFGLGLWWKLFSKNNKSWMDLISKSEVKILDK